MIEAQVLLLVFSTLSVLSAAWLVLHARDVVLLLRYLLPLDPGQGQRLASFKAVSAAITIFAFSLTVEVLVFLRAAAG